jgi:hypothetical protein
VSLGAGPHTGRLTQVAPVLLIQLYFVFLRGGFDAFPGGITFNIGHPLHLLEAGDRVAHVSSVMDGFFALLGESEVLVGDMSRLASVILDMLLDRQTKGRFTRATAGTHRLHRSIRVKTRLQ